MSDKSLKAKQISLIVKCVSVFLLLVFYVLSCLGIFVTNVDDIIKVCVTIVAVFLDISINTAIDKFSKKIKDNVSGSENLNEGV